MTLRLLLFGGGKAWTILITVALTLWLNGHALASDMTFTLVRSDYRSMGLDLYQLIYADGEIVPGTADQLAAKLAQWGIIPGGYVYLNSPGGSVVEAMKLGEVIRTAGLETDVGVKSESSGTSSSGGICASACALAYLGGDFRFISPTSVYAVHRFFSMGSTQLDSDTTQLLSGLIVSYISRMGADPELFRVMTTKGRDDLTIVPHEMLRRYRVVTDSIKSTTWSIQNADGAIYLRVVQEELRGTNKLLFFCPPRKGLTAMGFLNTASGASIVSETIHRGWMIDGRFIDIDPSVLTSGPVARNNYVEITTQVTAALLARILSAETVGLATQGLNRGLFAGFEIKMDEEGRKALSDFVKTCH